MNQKVLGSVFVLAVALGMISVAVRSPQTTPAAAPVVKQVMAPTTAAKAEPEPVLRKDVPRMDRALASYRVYEYGIERGMDFRGAQYNARVSETEIRFGTSDGSLILGAPQFEQGSAVVGGNAPTFVHPAFGVAKLERGPVTEEYVFENRRMEQSFHIASPLGQGALKVRVPLATTFPSVVETRAPGTDTFDAVEFANGGVAVLDPAGTLKFTCTSAVAWDSAKNRITLSPRHENGEIVMEIPASFMATATYPIVVDPWFGTGGSNSGGGISNTAKTSDRPAMKDNLIAWADSSSGNFEIYAKLWTGSGFAELGGSASGGGVSGTPGDSLNPAVAESGGNPTIAWEENTGAGTAIFLKEFPRTAVGGVWSGLGISAQNLGLSNNFGSNLHPAVGLLRAVVPGLVTINPTTGLPQGSPASHPVVPVVAWDGSTVNGGIFVSAFYPGAPAIPPTPTNPLGFPAVPEGWYPLGSPNGTAVNPDSIIAIGTGEYPSLVVDGLNQVTVAWHGVPGINYEIMAARWTLNASNPPNEFQIVAASASQFNMLPAANFKGIAAPGSPFDNVSNTPTPSQYPSLCLDSFGGLSIAWMETEAAAPPNPATSSQIYLRRSAGGAWLPLANSASPGGISRTGLSYDGAGQTPPVPGNASAPSVSAGGGYLGVAWADTSNSRSSIYIRRCVLPAGTTWEQIGFQGSAFPPRLPLIAPPAVPEAAPISGVSKSPNYSYQPQLLMGAFPLVVWADGSGSTYDIQAASFWPNGPGQAINVGTNQVDFQLTIRQTSTDPTGVGGGTDIPVASFTSGTSVFISSRVFTENLTPPAVSMWLEIELVSSDTPFQGRANYQVLFVGPDTPPAVLPAPPPTSLAVIKIDGLPNNNYHYQTRSIDEQGRFSPWFEQANIGNVAFRVNSAASGGGSNGPANTTPVVAGNGKHRGNCGLLGLEAAALLGLIRIIRRRRSK